MINAKSLYLVVFLFFLLPTLPVFSQKQILPNAYAHNDYWHKRPLFDALDNGFTYVEADVYLRGNKLVVAHHPVLMNKKRTLEKLYLKPLMEYVTANKNTAEGMDNFPITLMIDIKTSPDKTYEALEVLIEKYKSILSGYEDGRLVTRYVTIVLTGHKPYNLLKVNKNRFAFMDEDLKHTGRDSTANTYPIASCKYSNLVKWKGKGMMPSKQKARLEYYVTQAHDHGRKVRLWGSPENKVVWDELLKCNVDLINTDKLVALKNFLLTAPSLLTKKEQLIF